MKYILRLAFLFTLLTQIIPYSNAQLTIANGSTAQQLGNNLAGANVNVLNATISGDPDQYGTFQYTGIDLGLNSGVILSTGNIFDAVGPNTNTGTSSNMGGPGDIDLTALAGFSTNDAVVFEFDFEVQGDEIEFNFVFLSEEYNEFVNSSFNDVFAFYISGPGIVGQENLAIVPGTTTPVTINSINNGSFWQYFVDNTGGGVNIEFDGFTTLMSAAKNGLTQCGIYTLSLRIADGSDSALDSGVLLQENSLVQSNISATSSTFSANNTALEGCIDASFTFQLDSILPNDVNINIGIGGTATNGVDYSQIDSIITIPAGQTEATIIIDAIADGLIEGQEVIELYFSPTPCAPQDTILLFIDDYNPIEYNVYPSDVTCNGLANGQVDLTLTGGIPPYTLTLTDSLTGNITNYTSFPVTNLDIGTYYVDVIDGYGCTAADIVAGNLFDAGTTFIPDGQGGSYSSIINLSGFGAAQTITTPDQIQSICATMEHSRIGELEISLTAPDGTIVILKQQPGGAVTNMGEPCAIGPADAGNTDTLPGIGYNYCWQNISTYGTMVSEANNFTYTYINPCDGSSQSDKYLPAGSYQPYESFTNFVGAPLNGDWEITITDAIPNNNGYIFDWSISLQADAPDSIFTIYQPDLPDITTINTNPDCSISNGAIDLTVTNGAPPFTFLWNTGATTEDINGLPSGTYSVDITDDSLCVYSQQVTLSNNGVLTLSGTTNDESCAGINDGSIDLTVSNGALPITYSWDSGETSEDISGLAPGNYIVTVTDALGCQGVMSFTINPAGNINITASITNENCGDMEGIIDITVLGTTNPTTFLWSNGEVFEDINELTQGTYSVQITDANGCYETDTFTVINLVGNCVPNCDLEISASTVIDETCGTSNGSINLTLFSTNGPIQISWNSGQTTEDINSLIAGTYEVTLTDNEGCEVIQPYTIINQTGSLSVDGINTTNEYCGNGQGGADATISGGALPYTYSWDSGETTEDLSGVIAGTYTLTVTDANGCSANSSVTIINDAGTLAQTYGNAADEVCGNSLGSIDIIIEGGQLPYSFNWSNGATTEDLIGISAGTYSCIITDAGGCSISTPVYTVNNQAGTLVFDLIDVDNEVCSNTLGEIELFYSGGTAPFTYSWNTGQTTQNIFNLSAGTYEGTITDASGCSITTGSLVVLNESGTLSLDAVNTFDELCGNGTGSVNITVSGGTAPISYQWDNGSNSEDISNLSAGNYSCVVTDSNGCTVYAGATINNDPGIIAIDNIIITNETCGQGDGALDVIVSGAAVPVSYLWNTGDITEDLSALIAGTYTIDIIDNNGCTTSGSAAVINDAGTLSLDNSQVTNETCGATDGAIDITVIGGVAPLTYSWDSGQGTEDISGLSAGTYTCTITDGAGCIVLAGPYTINNSSGAMSVTLLSSINEICGNTAGAIDVAATGGTAPYSYSWDSGQSTGPISGINAGTYTCTVTDAAGCQSSITVELINEAGTLEISSIIVTDENCGNVNGEIDITVSNGTSGYSFLWSNVGITEDLTGLSAGAYDVTVTDAAGCSVNSGSIALNNNAGLFTVDGINTINENCGDGTGNIDLIVSGNTGTVSYLWNTGDVTQDLNNISAGSYSGTATDVNGCTVTFSTTIFNDPGTLIVTEVISNATCGFNSGAIDITVSGGLDPNTYVWSNGSTTEDISGLTAGNYTCNIVDANGCSVNYTGTVLDLGNPSISGVSVTDESCGNSDGSISVTATDGVGPYTYSWAGPPASPCCIYTLEMQDQGNSWNGASIDVFIDGVLEGNYTVPGGGANTETFQVCTGETIELSWNTGGFDNEVSFDLLDGSGTIVFSQGGNPTPGIIYTGAASCSPASLDGPTLTNISAGTYTVVVTDFNGCQDSTTIVVNNTSGTLQFVSELIINETCSDANGAIDLNVSGANPISFTWNTGATTEDITNLSAGSYTVDIVDNDGCTINGAYSLTNFTNGLTISSSAVTDENCSDGIGAIDITTSGGIGTLSYIWSNNFTAEDLINLSAGTYTVTISDGSVCDYQETFIINNIANGMLGSIVITDETCGNTNGSIDLTMTGGTAPLTYLWNNGSTSEDITGLSAGTYTVEVTDATSCEYIIDVIVEGTYGNIVLTAAITDEDCGNIDGAIDLTVNGGTAPYTYSWSSGETSEDLSNIQYGNYTVTVTDGNGCSVSATYNVASTGNFAPDDVIIVNEDCNGANGSIELVFSGFGNPNQFNWSNGETTQNISNLIEGWYTVEMIRTFGGGCTIVDSFYVGNNPGSLLIDSMVIINESCSLADGVIDVFVSGGTAPLIYTWNTGDITQDLSGLAGGTYSIDISDANGCTAFGSATISNYTFGFGVAGAIISDENCGNSAGSIDITITGGSSPYTYNWSSGQTTEDLTGVSAGTYSITITDAAGCAISNNFTVLNETNGFTVSAVVTDETCGNANGIIDLTITAGIAPISITWSNAEVTEDIVGLTSGIYSCIIVDNVGCTLNISETVGSLSANFDIGTPTVVDENCGDGTGSIVLNPTGGTAPLTYSWDNSNPCCEYTLNMYDLNNNGWGGNPIAEVFVYINGTVFGNFTVPVGNGNSFNTVQIPLCTGDLLEVEYVEAAQNGNNTYEILDPQGNIIFADGPNPFNGIAFTTNSDCSAGNVNTLTDLNAGLYPVEITDANGCIIQDTITLNNITGGFDITNANIISEACNDGTGSIDITITGGVTPYTFSWSNGEITEDISGLSAGQFDLTITDAAGCEVNGSYTIINTPGTLAITSIITTDENCGDGAGAIDITVTGGTTPYTFNWNTAETTEDIAGLSAGQYDVTLTDAAGCEVQDTMIIINITNGFDVSNALVTDEICGDGTGAIDITVTGGVSPYSFLWSNTEITEDINGLSAGQYIVTITDASNCELQDTIIVGNNTGGFNIASAVITDENCEDGTGAIDITMTGGVTPYIFSWSNGEITEDINGLSAGQFDLTVIDASGCELIASYSVNTNGAAVNVTGVIIAGATCAACTDGTINISVDPASTPYSFSWSNGSITEDISGLGVGTYTVTITNADGCSTTLNYDILDVTGLPEKIITLNINPNPSEGVFELSYANINSNSLTLKVIDASGRIVMENIKNIYENVGNITIDLSAFESGAYMLIINTEKFSTIKRLIIHK